MALKNEIFGKRAPTEVRIVGGVDYELFIDFLFHSDDKLGIFIKNGKVMDLLMSLLRIEIL